jgi:uncharacterized membrane protein (UPF0127 family)
MRETSLLNKTKGQTVSTKLSVADTSLSRLFGLMGRKGLDAGAGLWIRPSSGVHTFGMRFPIDVVALDKSLRVVGLWPNLKPFRVTPIRFKTHSVVELPAGQIASSQICLGDELVES